MSTLDTLQALPRLFRSADLCKFTGNANVFLTRARERGLITRLTYNSPFHRAWRCSSDG